MSTEILDHTISINDVPIRGEFTVSHGINKYYILATILIPLETKTSLGDNCVITVSNNNSQQVLISGKIVNIITEHTRQILHVKENIFDSKEHLETFSECTLQDIFSKLGKIDISSDLPSFTQLSIQGNKKEFFVNTLKNFGRNNKIHFYYSIREHNSNRSLVVRTKPNTDQCNLYTISSYKSYSQEILSCTPILGIQVGDIVKILDQKKVVTDVMISTHELSLKLKEIV